MKKIEYSLDSVNLALVKNVGKDRRGRRSRAEMTRRRVIIGSATVGISIIAASYSHQLGSALRNLIYGDELDFPNNRKGKYPAFRYNRIPNTASVKACRNFLEQYPLEYLSANEILQPHFKTRGGISSGIPPEHLWKNMITTLRVADEVRRRLGVTLHKITSAYRSPAYNAKCPGASKYSQHMRNSALDLVYSCPSRKAFDTAEELRKEGFFKGGLGLYNNFIHIDTRGRNATWGT